MSHTIELTDKAYQALAQAAQASGKTPEALVEDWALHLGHDPAQAWFWTPEWQAGERHASEEIAAGQTEFFDDEDAFLAVLEAEADTES